MAAAASVDNRNLRPEMSDRARDARNPDGTHGEVLAAISGGVTGLYKDHYGRGPTMTKSYYDDDLVVCILHGGFGKAEETLRDRGMGDVVLSQRLAFQNALRGEFIAVVEEATGREVLGFMSSAQQDPDLMCEVFVLAPETRSKKGR